MKVSIVVPVYNGEETLRECLEAILNIDYPKSQYELVVVNDASKDSSKEIILNMRKIFKDKGLNLIFLNFKKNKGRIEARLAGAERAEFDYLLFVDQRALVDPSILRKLKEKNYEPIIGKLYQKPGKSIISRFFYVFRNVFYGRFFDRKYPDTYINKYNFNSIGKGFSPFFCKRNRFYNSLPKEKGKWVSDDIRIFSNMVETTEILKTSEVLCLYKERTSFKDFFVHLYNRGPGFVDFYWKLKSKYFPLIIILLFSPFLFLGVVFFLNIWFLFFILGFLLLSTAYLFSRGFSFLDISSFFLATPLVVFTFTSGLYKGLFMKIFVSGGK